MNLFYNILYEIHNNDVGIVHTHNTIGIFAASLKENYQEACHEFIEVIQMS